MGYHDSAGSWLQEQLRHERRAMIDKLIGVPYPALEDPAMTRKSLRELIRTTTRL